MNQFGPMHQLGYIHQLGHTSILLNNGGAAKRSPHMYQCWPHIILSAHQCVSTKDGLKCLLNVRNITCLKLPSVTGDEIQY